MSGTLVEVLLAGQKALMLHGVQASTVRCHAEATRDRPHPPVAGSLQDVPHFRHRGASSEQVCIVLCHAVWPARPGSCGTLGPQHIVLLLLIFRSCMLARYRRVIMQSCLRQGGCMLGSAARSCATGCWALPEPMPDRSTWSNSCQTHCIVMLSQLFWLTQIIPWARLDQRFEVLLPEAARPGGNENTTCAKAPYKGGKPAAPTIWVYPLMYAVELRQPSWLVPMVASAKAFFLLDAEQIDTRLLQVSYIDAAAQRYFAPKAERLVAQKMSDWVNASIGAANPPTALFRYSG